MKPKLLVSLFFVVSVGSGWLFGMEDEPEASDNENDEACSLVNQVCSYLGFGDDAYGKLWDAEYDEEKYKKQVILRFKKAKVCAVSGVPLLWCGAFTLEKTTGSCNPLSLIFANDSSGSLEVCNKELNAGLVGVTRFVTHPDSGPSIVHLNGLHKKTCENLFPQEEAYSFSSNLPESVSVCSALAMMVKGGFLTVCSLVHLGSGLFGVCYMGYCNVFHKSDHKKVN